LKETQVQELLIHLKLLLHRTVKLVTVSYLVQQMQAHKLCVALSLSAIVFNFRNSITSSADLIQIMNIGNNMYSALTQSAKQGLQISVVYSYASYGY